MITPIDIQKKEFTKGVRGYKEEEVDSYLDLITLDMEKLIMENKRLKDTIAMLTSEVERYRGSENAVLETLEAAKALMRDISASAEKRAEFLVKNAELDAERIKRDAKESVERLTDDAVNLRNRVNLIRSRFRNLLETELERFDTLSAELFPESADMLKTMGAAAQDAAKPAQRETPKPALRQPAAGQLADETARLASKTIPNLRSGDSV
ncbi:MAG: DivIVA domain-containing protein [Clostridiales Family XIII bacterium]|jgi:cell division initiation protein|nr:DivIVA domain-containing protein [Clostridiales Family XIII bacterium]